MNKRKRDDGAVRKPERKRPQKRSRSETSVGEATTDATKRIALRRLFGRVCSVDLDDSRRVREDEVLSDSMNESQDEFSDENEDPLLDSVPVNMDPEQLGFLVCAQETLRFLHRRGIPLGHPVFARLRSRFRRGLTEMGIA